MKEVLFLVGGIAIGWYIKSKVDENKDLKRQLNECEQTKK